MTRAAPGPGPATRCGVVLAAALLLLAGCTTGKRAGGETRSTTAPSILTGVIDEARELALASQVEGAALEHLWNRPSADEPLAPPYEELRKNPASHRGKPVRFKGKLVWRQTFTPREDCARLGKTHKGLILLAEGSLVAFRCRAERAPTKEAVAADVPIPVNLPKVGKPVEVTGFFLKRWVALDSAGKDYMVMPLLAARSVTALGGAEAEKLARTRILPGKLPLKELQAPEVWRRPVVEYSRRDELRLDGRPVTWRQLEEKLYPLAARHRNPLGDSALAVVILVDAAVPQHARARLRKVPANMGARSVLRVIRSPEK